MVTISTNSITQSAGAAEYTDCIFEDEWNYPNECLWYDSIQSDGDVSVMLELWETQSIPSLQLILRPLCPRVLAPNRVLFMGQIELFDI